MPQRVNSLSDIGTAKVSSDSYDVDNIFLTDQGWVYRHWKSDPKDATVTPKRYWDEIIVAGQVDIATNAPVTETLYVPGPGNAPYLEAIANLEVGDGNFDVEYSVEGGASPAVGTARYTTYAQYPPLPLDSDVDPDSDDDASGGDDPVATSPSDVTLVFTGADGTSSYTSAGGANASVTIEAGGTLTITNNTSGHPVDVRVSDEGDTVSTGTLTGAPAGPGESLTWDTTGVTPGTYYYQCTAHATMVGQIIVT